MGPSPTIDVFVCTACNWACDRANFERGCVGHRCEAEKFLPLQIDQLEPDMFGP